MRVPLRLVRTGLVIALCLAFASCSSDEEPPRVLVIGLDGANWEMIDPLIAAGELPNLARLREAGAWGELQSVVPPLSAPAWTTAVTGVNPGRHGVLNFLLVDPSTYGLRMATSRDRLAPAVWEYLCRQGREVVIMNVPLTSPADSVNGTMIGGFPHVETSGTFFPPQLERELADSLGAPRWDDYGERLPPGGEIAFLDDLLETLASKLKTARYLMRSRDWDLFWVVFLASDKASHFFWRYSDPDHPGHDPQAPPRLKGAMSEVWKRLDAAVGELVEEAGPRTTIMILSDHGSGPVSREFRLLPWLLDEGLSDRDLEQARFLCFQPYGGELFLHDERFAQGIVPNAARDSLLELATERLLSVRAPDSGEPVVTDVFRRDEIYRGAAAARAADLLFEGAPGWLISRGKGAPGAEIFGPPYYTFSGYHRPQGLIILAGAGAAAGGRSDGARLLDVAPTLLYLSGEPIPRLMEGEVLRSLIDPRRLERDPPRVTDLQLERSPEEIEAIRAIPYLQ